LNTLSLNKYFHFPVTFTGIEKPAAIVGSLTTCGHEQIEPTYDKNSVYKLEGFKVPKPLGKG